MIEVGSFLYEVHEHPPDLADKVLVALRWNHPMCFTIQIGTIERYIRSVVRRPDKAEIVVTFRHEDDGVGSIVLYVPDDQYATATVAITNAS